MEKQNFYLMFGSVDRGVDEIAQDITEKTNFNFEKRSSDYLGDYCKFYGTPADRFIVESNYVGGDYKEIDFKDYQSLIGLSFITGKNEERESKCKDLRTRIVDEILGVVLLKERIETDAGMLIKEMSTEEISMINRNSKKNYM